MQGFEYKKAVQTLNYLAFLNGGEINKMKALKIIWIADRMHLRKFGRLILNDRYYAMKYGPVASKTKEMAETDTTFSDDYEIEYRDKYIKPTSDNYNYSSIADVDMDLFSETDIETLEISFKKFYQLDEFKLSEYSHLYPEWKKFKDYIESKKGSRFDIDFIDFFNDPEDNENDFFKLDPEHLESSKEIFLETN